MAEIQTFSEARERLRQFYRPTHHYDPAIVRQFMATIGSPQDKLRVIHIAGTSGKTSTTYYIAALLRAAGYRVGSTVSPHVDEINERVQIGLVPLPEADFCRELDEFLELVEQSHMELSYFEVMVAFAYWYFDKVQVDFVVIETGLGGRLDATNIVSRADKVCVLTSIGLDHTKILGDSLAQIAAEKAGIIQPGNQVFTYPQSDEVMEVFRRRCAEVGAGADLQTVPEVSDPTLHDLPLFQQSNFQLARSAARAVLGRQGQTLQPAAEAAALATYIPARMEHMLFRGRDIIVDGAHNGQKLQSLCESIRAKYPGKQLSVLAAFVEGDDARVTEGLGVLMRYADGIIFTEFQTEQDLPKRSVLAENLADFCRQSGYGRVVVEPQAERALLQLVERDEDVLLVAGSFYLLNSVRPLMAHTTDSV